jgi:hypothetical protein
VNLGVTIVSLGLNLVVMRPRMERILQAAMAKNPQLNTPMMQAAVKMGAVTGYATSALIAVWAVILLYYMTRPYMRAAFEARPATS